MRINIKKFIGAYEYIVVLFIILEFHSVYSNALNRNYYVSEIACFLILGLLVIRIVFVGFKKNTLIKWVKYNVVYYAFAIILMILIVDQEHLVSYISRYLIVLPILSFLFAEYADKGNLCILFDKYTSLMTILAGISIIFWIFGSQLHILHPSNAIQANWGGVYSYPTYYGLYFERQTQKFLFFDGLRNEGIFLEAPMYSVALVIAISYVIFIRNIYENKIKCKNMSKIELLILITALLTTITTTGFIVLLIIIGLQYLITRPKDRIAAAMKWALAFFVVMILFYLVAIVFEMKSTSFSWKIRTDDLRASFLGWLHSPIYGNGYSSNEGVDPYRLPFRSTNGETGMSNTLMFILAQGGLIFFLMHYYPVFEAIKASMYFKNKGLLAFILVFTIESAFTSINNTHFLSFCIAFFYGVSNTAIKARNKITVTRREKKTITLNNI